MIVNDFQRLKVWAGLRNRFDYQEYIEACAANGCGDFATRVEFAQKAGVASAAISMFPDLPIGEAYMMYIDLNERPVVEPMVLSQEEIAEIQKNCGGCGGGKIR